MKRLEMWTKSSNFAVYLRVYKLKILFHALQR